MYSVEACVGKYLSRRSRAGKQLNQHALDLGSFSIYKSRNPPPSATSTSFILERICTTLTTWLNV